MKFRYWKIVFMGFFLIIPSLTFGTSLTQNIGLTMSMSRCYHQGGRELRLLIEHLDLGFPPTLSYRGGGFISLRKKQWGYWIGGEYAMRYFKVDLNRVTVSEKNATMFRWHMFEIPTLLTYHCQEQLRFSLGPVWSFLPNLTMQKKIGSRIINYKASDLPPEKRERYVRLFRKINIGLDVGIAYVLGPYTIGVGGRTLLLDLRNKKEVFSQFPFPAVRQTYQNLKPWTLDLRLECNLTYFWQKTSSLKA